MSSPPPAGATVVVTGSSGSVGQALLETFPSLGWRVVGVDLVDPPVPLDEPHQSVRADAFSPDVLDELLPGVSGLVALAAEPNEAPLSVILESHLIGLQRTLDAAVRHGVRRIVWASSNHAVGFTPRSSMVGADTRPRPDTYYGVGKAAAEALCSLYCDKFGLDIVALRIGSLHPEPSSRRHLSTWLSHADLTGIVDAALRTPLTGFHVVYAISGNAQAWWDLAPTRELGWIPVDNAEDWAHAIAATTPELASDDPDFAFLGGGFAGPEQELGVRSQ